MDATTHKVLIQLRQEMSSHAEASMQFPKDQPFDHGVQIGEWRGLQRALQIVDAVLKDTEETEARL